LLKSGSGTGRVFLVAVLIFLALDLGVFHRSAHVVKFKEAMTWTVVWFTMAMLFAFFIATRDHRGIMDFHGPD